MGYIQVPADGVGKRVDTVTLTDELAEVHRQKMVLTGASGTAEVVVVTNAAPAGTDMGLVVRHAGTATVAGTVNVNGGVAISGTATVAGVVGLTAGTANIGSINHISRTVQVAIGTPFTLQGISTTVTVAVSTPFTLQGISTTVQVAISTPFTVNNISATVTVAGAVTISGTAAVSAVIRTSGGTAVEDTTNNALRVNVVAGSGGGLQQTDGTPFTAQEGLFIPMGGVFDDASPGTLSEGDAGAFRLTTNRALHVNHRTDGGVAMEDSANAALRVNVVAGSSGGVSQVDGTTFSTQAANFVPIGGIFDDAASDTLSENDAGVVRLTTARAFHVNLRDAAGGGLGTAGNALAVNVHAISGTASVVLAAGAANIGSVNNISATVTVAGNINISATASVILAAGTANFGTLNDISRTVQVAIGTPFTVNNISATVVISGNVGLTAGTSVIGDLNAISRTVQVAVGTPFTINNISATVTVAGVVALTAGTANIGSINNISATVTTAIRSMWVNTAVPSASRGPRCIIASTSSNVSLVAAPGAGMAVYVTALHISNASGSNTRARIGTSASIGQVQNMMAASGGGFVMQFNPPWELSANEALLGSVKPNASEGIFNIHFFVASADAL